MLGIDGKIVLYGLMGGTVDHINGGLMSKLLFNRISLLPLHSAFSLQGLQSIIVQCVSRRCTMRLYCVGEGDLTVDVEHCLPLEDVLKAHNIMRMNRNIGKIVLMVSDQTATLEWFGREVKQLEKLIADPKEKTELR